MPIYIEVSRLYRCATVVARGKITREEILATAEELIDADIPLFAKLIDVATPRPTSRPATCAGSRQCCAGWARSSAVRSPS